MTPPERLNLSGVLEVPPSPNRPRQRRPARVERPAAPGGLNLSGVVEAAPASPRRSRPASASPAPRNPHSADDYLLDGDWSPERGEAVKSWFKQTYGRDLPHKFGQTPTHDRMGLDHSSNMDVQVNPTSAEGRALAAYLKESRIPFLAYNTAKAGAATGPHFHVGRPSRGLGAQPALNLNGVVEEPLSLDGILEPNIAADFRDAPDPLAGQDVQEGEEVVRDATPPSLATPAPAPSLYTTEGRARRDAHARAERGGGGLYRLPVGSGSSTEAVERAVAQIAKDVDAPVEYVRGWLGKKGLGLYEPGTQRELQSSPTGHATIPAEMIGELRRDYSASLNLPTRAVRNVSEVLSTHTPGEMFTGVLNVAGEPAGAFLSKGAELAGRAMKPLDMFSARLWTRLGGGTPEQARAASDAVWNDEPLPAYAENFVAEDVERDMAQLNPRIGKAYGALTRFLTDPTNFVPVGGAVKLADKFADGVRAFRAARRAEEVAAAVADVERVAAEAGLLTKAAAPVPESAETLGAQFKSALNSASPRVGVLVTPGERPRRVPRGFAVFDVDAGRLYLSRAKLKEMGLTSAAKVEEHLSRNGFEGLIGKVAPVEDTSKGVALRTEDAAGRELSTSVVPTANAAEAQAASDLAQFPQAARQELGSAQEMAGRRLPQNVLAADPPRPGAGRVVDEAGLRRKALDHNMSLDEVRAEALRQGYTVEGGGTQTVPPARAPETLNLEGVLEPPPRTSAAVAQDIRVTHAGERADFYSREAARAKDPVHRAEAERLAAEYADEAAEARVSNVAQRVKSGVEVAPEEMADLERAVIGEDGAPAFIEVNVSAAPAPGARAAAGAARVKSPLRRAWDAGLDAFDATKSAFASLDASAAGRQAFVPFLFDTRATVRGLREGAPSVMARRHAAFGRWLDSQPDAVMWRDLGLDLDTMTGSGTHNEFFTSHMAEKVPVYGDLVVKPSDRLMTAQLDAVRLQNARSWERSLRRMGATPETHPEDYRAVAKLINTASGRAELGRVGQAIHPVTRRVIFSPKLLKSRFAVLNPLTYAKLPPAARRVAGRRLGSAAAKLAGIFGLAYLTADSVGLNPFKGDFGLARYGDTTYDLTGGVGSKLRTVFQLVYSVGATANAYAKGEPVEYKDTPWGIGAHFLRSQLAPSYSLPVDAISGETFDHKPFTWTGGVLSRITPGFAQDVYQGWVEGSGPLGAVKALPSFLGVSTRTRDREELKREWAAAREASKKAFVRERTAEVLKDAPADVRDELLRLRVSLPESDAPLADLIAVAVERARSGPGWGELNDAQRKKFLENVIAGVRKEAGAASAERATRAGQAKEGERVVLTGRASEEVGRLGVVVDAVPAGHSVSVSSGESVRFRGEHLGQTPEQLDEYRRRLAEETQAAVERVMSFEGYAERPDAVKRAALQTAVDGVKTRLRGAFHFDTRQREHVERERLEEYQRELEGRSRQLKPVETLKLGEGEGGDSSTANRFLNLGGDARGAASVEGGRGSRLNLQGVLESVNVEDRRADGPFDPVVDEIRRVGPSPVTETQATDAALLLDSLDEERFASFAENLVDVGRLGRVAEGAAAVFEHGARAAGALGSRDASEVAGLVAVQRLLARERRLRPEQFTRDALAGRYGVAVQWEVGRGSILEPPPERLAFPSRRRAHDDIRRAVDAAKPDAEPTFQEFPEGMSESRVPRSSMPQIKSRHRGALVQFLKARGITHEQVEVDPRSLKPSQRDYSPEKVAKAKTFDGPDRSILISSDGFLLDGHHGWLSHLDDETVPAIRLDAPIQQLLVEAARFPSSGVDDAGR